MCIPASGEPRSHPWRHPWRHDDHAHRALRPAWHTSAAAGAAGRSSTISVRSTMSSCVEAPAEVRGLGWCRRQRAAPAACATASLASMLAARSRCMPRRMMHAGCRRLATVSEAAPAAALRLFCCLETRFRAHAAWQHARARTHDGSVRTVPVLDPSTDAVSVPSVPMRSHVQWLRAAEI